MTEFTNLLIFVLSCVFVVMETEFVDNEKTLTYLREQIEALNQQILVYFDDIKIVNKFHRTCET